MLDLTPRSGVMDHPDRLGSCGRALVRFQRIGVFARLDEEIARRIDDLPPARGVIRHRQQGEKKLAPRGFALALILHDPRASTASAESGLISTTPSSACVQPSVLPMALRNMLVRAGGLRFEEIPTLAFSVLSRHVDAAPVDAVGSNLPHVWRLCFYAPAA